MSKWFKRRVLKLKGWLQVNRAWMKWTLGEALTKTGSKLLQKVVGVSSHIVGHTFLATAIVGLVQIIGGLFMARANRAKLLTDSESIVGACLFGFFATLSTVLGFVVFMLGGDIGINTFIITLSIVPGALIDRFFFGHKLNARQWLGVLMAILAGYSVLGWPSLQEAVRLPAWVWVSLIMTMSVAINQGITQKIRKINPFVKNFWGGLTTFILALAGLVIVGGSHLLSDFSGTLPKLWLSSALVGLIVIVMWSFNLLAYKDGAQIAIKKLVMNGAYLTMAMIFGILLFSESLTAAKVVGVAGYLVGFSLLDNSTWRWLTGRFSM